MSLRDSRPKKSTNSPIIYQKKIIESGFAYIVTTVLKGRKTLRMCIINANTIEDDILKTTALLDEIATKEAGKFSAEE